MHLASRSGLVVGVAHALLALLVRGGEGTWRPTAGVDQNWSAAANWSGIDAFPWLLDDSAALTGDLAAPQTVNLGGAWTVGTLLIGDPVAPWHPFTLGPTAAVYFES